MRLIAEQQNGNSRDVTAAVLVCLLLAAGGGWWFGQRQQPANIAQQPGEPAAATIPTIIGTRTRLDPVGDGAREPATVQHSDRKTYEQTFDLSKCSGRRTLIGKAASCEVVDGLAMTSTGWQQVPHRTIGDSNTCQRYGGRIIFKTDHKQEPGAFVRVRFTLSD